MLLVSSACRLVLMPVSRKADLSQADLSQADWHWAQDADSIRPHARLRLWNEPSKFSQHTYSQHAHTFLLGIQSCNRYISKCLTLFVKPFRIPILMRIPLDALKYNKCQHTSQCSTNVNRNAVREFETNKRGLGIWPKHVCISLPRKTL